MGSNSVASMEFGSPVRRKQADPSASKDFAVHRVPAEELLGAGFRMTRLSTRKQNSLLLDLDNPTPPAAAKGKGEAARSPPTTTHHKKVDSATMPQSTASLQSDFLHQFDIDADDITTATTQKMASPKPRPVGSTSPDPSNYHDPDPTQHSRSQQFSTSAPKSDRDEEKDEEVVQKPASPAAAPLSPVAASVSLAPTKKKSPDPTLSPPLRSGLLTQLCAASDGEEKEEEEERDAAIKVTPPKPLSPIAPLPTECGDSGTASVSHSRSRDDTPTARTDAATAETPPPTGSHKAPPNYAEKASSPSDDIVNVVNQTPPKESPKTQPPSPDVLATPAPQDAIPHTHTVAPPLLPSKKASNPSAPTRRRPLEPPQQPGGPSSLTDPLPPLSPVALPFSETPPAQKKPASPPVASPPPADPAAGILVLSQPTPQPKLRSPSPQHVETRTSPTSHAEPMSEDDEKAAAEYMGSYLYGLTLKNEWKDLKRTATHLIRAQATHERMAPDCTKLSTEAFALVKKLNALKKLSQLALDIPEDPDFDAFEDMVT